MTDTDPPNDIELVVGQDELTHLIDCDSPQNNLKNLSCNSPDNQEFSTPIASSVKINLSGVTDSVSSEIDESINNERSETRQSVRSTSPNSNALEPRGVETSLSAEIRALRTRRQTIIVASFFPLTPKTETEGTPYQLYQEIITNKAVQMYNLANEAYEKGSYEPSLSYLRKALVLDPNNVSYYVLLGDTYLQLCDFKSAILNYKRVCILDPENDDYFSKLAFIYFLHGQCYYDEEMYLDALECFTRAVEMKPDNAGYHSRCIACLADLKRHKECLELINKRLEVNSNNPDLLILRARLYLLFNNSTLSYMDVKEALQQEPDNPEADFMRNTLKENAELFKEKALKLDMSSKTKEAITKISHAIDANPSVIEYHVLRAGMHRRNCDFNASVDDLLLAMNKCNQESNNKLYLQAQKQLLLTFNDFAVDCFKGFYEEAIVLLEKAIKGEKDDKALYTNRGDCFYKLDHLHFALLDYQQAEELTPEDKSIALRLSVVYNELGIIEYKDRKYYRAEDYFSLAISHNTSVSMYYLSRARSRYMQENLAEAQIDIISALYLDPSSKEIFSMFARLYPGKTIDEILKSEYGLLVIEALIAVIDDSKKTYHEHDTTEMMTNSKACLPRIDQQPKYSERLKQCMDDQQFHYSIIKGKKKVNDLVETVIQCRQDLSFNGPVINTNTRKQLGKKLVKKKSKPLEFNTSLKST